jgi:hypothetical protein
MVKNSRGLKRTLRIAIDWWKLMKLQKALTSKQSLNLSISVEL